MKDYGKIKEWIDSALKENPELDYNDFIRAVDQERTRINHEKIVQKSLENK